MVTWVQRIILKQCSKVQEVAGLAVECMSNNGQGYRKQKSDSREDFGTIPLVCIVLFL